MHHHEHHGGHTHAAHGHRHDTSRRRLVLVIVLTAGFMVLEFAGGWIANSLALMADAGHMLGDVSALGLSLFALWFARRPATPEKSYGWLRIEILAALGNGVALGVIAVLIFTQAWSRLRSPEAIQGPLMLGVAVAGLLVNLVAAFALHSSRGESLNLRGAYLHVLGDLLGSVGAILAAVIILTTGWLAADPIISCLVGILILVGSVRLVRESVDVLLEAVPRDIDLEAVQRSIRAIDGVEGVRDLHVWTLTSGYRAMSGHAVIDDPRRHNEILRAIHACMHDAFGIHHVTVQVEYPEVVVLRDRS